MKKIILSTLLVVAVSAFCTLTAQNKSNRPSPPAQLEGMIDGLKVTVDYSRPSVKERKIFGGLEPYGKVWRTGANETTWIEFSEDVKINGEALAKGKYGLFTIPNEDQWTIIFNKDWKGWGAYKYNQSNDVLRIDVDANNANSHIEQFTIGIDESGEMSLAWDKTLVNFTVSR